MGRWIRAALLFAFVGLVVTVLLAFASAVMVDMSATPFTGSVSNFDGRVEWNVQVAHARTAVRIASERGFPPWSVEQATGPPDTARAGDEHTAWASATPDQQPEWLELQYGAPVIVREVHVYETYNPGALAKVWLIDPQRGETLGWSGTDPTATTAGIGISKITVQSAVPTASVRIELDSAAVKGWNEIDTVGLLDDRGQLHWPVRARASSVYGSRSVTAPQQRPAIVPSWGGLDKPRSSFAAGKVTSEWRMLEGRGWPMIALWSELPATPAPPRPVLISGARLVPAGGGTNVSAASQVVFPRHVVWRGLALDTACFACAAAIGWWMLTSPVRFLIESGRIRRGRCLRCGYDLRYDFARGCPECGWRRDGNRW